MGRESRRKEAKRNGRDVKKTSSSENLNTLMDKNSSIKIIVVVISLLVLLYLILAIFITKELDLSTDKNDDSEVSNNDTDNSSVSNAILASATFNQSEEVYYVLFYGFEDEDDKKIAELVSNGLTDNKVYKVDIESGMNNNYVDTVSNPSVSTLETLKVSDNVPTLLRVSADSVDLYLEGNDSIETYLDS